MGRLSAVEYNNRQQGIGYDGVQGIMGVPVGGLADFLEDAQDVVGSGR